MLADWIVGFVAVFLLCIVGAADAMVDFQPGRCVEFCTNGKVCDLTVGKCIGIDIPPFKGELPKCGANETLNRCGDGIGCQPTCNGLYNLCQSMNECGPDCCRPVCECLHGMFRDSKGKCVERRDCDDFCSKCPPDTKCDLFEEKCYITNRYGEQKEVMSCAHVYCKPGRKCVYEKEPCYILPCLHPYMTPVCVDE